MFVAKPPKLIEPEIEPFTVGEAQRVLDVARTRRNGVRFELALGLGLRQGEALGLKWSDLRITWNHGCTRRNPCGYDEVEDCPDACPTADLTIRRALQRQTWEQGCEEGKPCGRKRGADCPQCHGGGLVIMPPKSSAGKRTVSVPEPLIHALLDHDEAQDDERHLAGDMWQEEGWIFAQPNGKCIDPRADYDEWQDLLKAARVRPSRLHDARHTAATMLLVLNVPHRAIMDVMGWSEASMLKRYVHVPDEIKRGIAGQVGGLLWRRQPDDDGPNDDDDDGMSGAPVKV